MTRLDLTRDTMFGDSDSIRVTLRKMVTRLEISEPLINKPSLFAYKERSFLVQ